MLKWHPLRDDSVTAFVTSKRTEVFVMQTNGCWKTRYEGNVGLALAHGAAIAGRMDDGRIGSLAAESRANNRIADEFAAMAGTHHTAAVFGVQTRPSS